MPKFLAGCHYNIEEISRPLKERKEKKKKDIGLSNWMATSLQPVNSWKNR